MVRMMSRWCSREGSVTGCRRCALAVWILGLALACLATGLPTRTGTARRQLHAAEESPSGSHAESSHGDKVRCPDCDKKGRMKCPECGGKGLLARRCPTCDGTGRRPCKVCTDGESADSPGNLVCPLCGGAGTVGDEGRTCSRCKGTQTIVCPTCLGKGSHPCRKEIFDKVCPTCRFAGKITCTTCGGELWLAPSELASRKARKTLDAPVPTARKRPPRRRSLSGDEGSEEETKAREDVDADSLRARFAAVTPTYESHYDVFADDLRFEVGEVEDKVKDLERRLERTGAGRQLRAELDQWQKRAREFHKRWGELHTLFKKERQAHLNARSVWETRDEGLKGLKGYRRELFEEQYRSRLAITTEIAETASARLARFQPATLVLEAKELGILWKEYEKRGEAELSLAKKAAEEEAKEAEAKKAAAETAKARAEEKRKADRASPRRPRNSDTRIERDERRQRSPSDMALAASRGSNASNGSDGSAGVDDKPRKVFRRADEDPPAPRSESGGPLGTVFAVLVGFAGASCFFFLWGFWRKRNGE